jgi:ribonuclease BN (tRNA processing enzyme)
LSSRVWRVKAPRGAGRAALVAAWLAAWATPGAGAPVAPGVVSGPESRAASLSGIWLRYVLPGAEVKSLVAAKGVRGRFVDHEMPCLAFVVEEKARARVAKDRLAALGVCTGSWLRELKLAVLSAAPAHTPIHLHWRDRQGEHDMTRSVGELAEVILDVAAGQRIGYVTDLRFTEANRRTLVQLLAGVDQLFIESVFLDADRAHAERKNHLTARQAGQIAREVGARAVVPFHFSPRYGQRAAQVAAEVQAAWSGPAVPFAAPGASDQEGSDASRSWTRAML